MDYEGPYKAMKEIFDDFYPQLVSSLPMNDAIFLSRLVKLLPGDLKEKVKSKTTIPEAAMCFLDNGIKPAVESGDERPLTILLTAMKNHSDHLRKLADKIQGAIRNKSLPEHVNGDQWAEPLLSCPLRETLDCKSMVEPSQLLQHSLIHVKEVIQNIQRDKDEYVRLQRDLAQQNARLAECYKHNTARLEEQIKQLNMAGKVSRIGDVSAATPCGVHSTDVANFEGNIRSLQNNFDVLACQIDTFNLKVEENTETVGTLQTEMNQCTKALTQVNGMVNEVGLKVDILAVRRSSGVLIWRVNEVEKRIEEAKTGKILSLYSPPFFTSLHGYRMCLRLYLNGDGQGKGTHVSLFMVIMKSDYDDFQTWPFKQKVTLYLLNQQDPYNTKAHIAQAFRPTETSTSFQKPRGPFNTASGFPKLAPVEKLQDRNFVQDDCMYFKVKVDMSGVKGPDCPA